MTKRKIVGSSPIESWRLVADSKPRYLISDWGRMWSIGYGRILKSNGGANHYPAQYIPVNGRLIKQYIHHLVLEAFVGPCPPGLQALHADDIKTNNHLSNLSWGTPSQNMRDRVRNGIHHFANRTHCLNCGDPLQFYIKQRECMRCMRIRKRDHMRRKRATQKETSI